MISQQPEIDPTDPIHTYDTETEFGDAEVATAMTVAKQSFPAFMDMATSIQLLQDVEQMADIRFRGLFDGIRSALREAAERYDEEYPEVARHTPYGDTALPNWEIIIGLQLDDVMVLRDEDMIERAEQTTHPEQLMSTLTGNKPVIEQADLIGFYHAYYADQDVDEVHCSYLAENLLEYDYCITVTEFDLHDFDASPVHLLESDGLRVVIASLLNEKIQTMYEAKETRDMTTMFEGYAAPLISCVQDYQHVYNVSDPQQTSQ